ncbi:MAG: lysine--tRNA ligase [Actinobacteria bacterium]|nr:lysine--tRNA ligase [Cyanobacteriota bacterium]MCL5771752.1 lysine--tRNA ligase [Actinomycetota bacterium]
MDDIKKQNEISKDISKDDDIEIEKSQLNIENIENSEAEYLLELETPIAEPLRMKLEKIKGKRKNGSDFYKAKFATNADSETIHKNFNSIEAGEKVEGNYSIAGRIMAIRKHGKATFAVLKDFSGQIQLYLNIKNSGEEKYNEFLDLDIGDIIGVNGVVFKTHTGELSINVLDFILLSKSIRILPEKWHGLKDKEIRYRQRYLDFIVNSEVKETFITRIKMIEAFRKFLTSRGFLEVETPMLQPIPGGATAKPFVTHHNALNMELYLRIAPELYLKRLIIGGFEKVFEINRNFRNEGISYKHNPEFTMLEFYQAFVDYNDLMQLTEELLKYVALEAAGKLNFNYRGNEIDFNGSWDKMTMIDSIKNFTGLDVNFDKSIDELRSMAKKNDLKIDDSFGKGKIINEFFEVFVQPNLIKPTFIKDYPVEISPLARKSPVNNNLTERFELFIGGEEIANAFSELIDPRDQFERFKYQVKSKDEEERISGKIDIDFLKALEYGMPPTGGEGIGIDRFAMVITNSSSIRDVILFPLMKQEKDI